MIINTSNEDTEGWLKGREMQIFRVCDPDVLVWKLSPLPEEHLQMTATGLLII